MDIEKLAERAAKRKNKKIAERYPLFADQFATTPEAEKQRILRQYAEAELYLDKLKRLSLEAWQRGEKYRDVAMTILPHDEFERIEQKWHRLFGNRVPEWDGAYYSDFWWHALYGTNWAFENCPHKMHHDRPELWVADKDRCPTCGFKP